MGRISLIIIVLASSAVYCRADGVSVVFSADIAPYRQAFDGFKAVMTAGKVQLRTVEHVLGKEDGKDIGRQLAAEDPQAIIALGPEASNLMGLTGLTGERLKETPLVLAMVLRPQSFAAPNVTWVALDIPARAKLTLLRRVLPQARRIGVVYSAGSAAQYRELGTAAADAGFAVVGREVVSSKELPEALRTLADRIDLFFMLPDTAVFFSTSIQYLLTEALKNDIPVVGLATAYTRAGALCAFEADYTEVGRQAGELALRIVNGEKPVRIPPLTPRKINMSLNLVVAERLGVSISPDVIREASDVFK